MPVGTERRRRGSAIARAVFTCAWWLAAGMAPAACYKPNITDGGLVCAAGKLCPDGYQCGADNHCELVPVTVVPPDPGADTKPMTDAGVADAIDGATDGGNMCMAPAALCDNGPAAGEACSPSCQKGCACGRCNVVDGKAACVPAGTVKLGEVCNPNADNCAAGFICLLESCGNGLARCYRHCASRAQCTDGTACTITIDDSKGAATSYTTCDVPPRACDPVAGSGCPDPALNCYLTSANQTLCDCPTRPAAQGGNNAPCTIYSECASGFVCISGVDGQTTPHCHFVCSVANPSCPATTHCVPVGADAKFGYCAIN